MNNFGNNGNLNIWYIGAVVPTTPGITVTVLPGQQLTFSFSDPDVENPVEKKKDSEGCACKKCLELYPYAEPNQEDGTLICYACRQGW